MGMGASVLRRRRAPRQVFAQAEDVWHPDNFDGSVETPGRGHSGHNTTVSPVEAGEPNSAGTTKIRCQKCGLVWKVYCGTTTFTCASCGAKVLVALSAVAEQASNQAEKHLRAARRELQTIMEQQAFLCQGLWEKLEEEVQLAQAMWNSQANAGYGDLAATLHALLREATSARDGAQVAEALSMAAEAGLPPPSEGVSETLRCLRQEEDLEVLWRCFMRALDEEDRVDLEFWRDEATVQGLCVPEEVKLVVTALRGAEHARLAELQYKVGFNSQVSQAHATGNIAALETLLQEANLLGSDPSAAQAALAALRGDGASSSAAATPPTQRDSFSRGEASPQSTRSTAQEAVGGRNLLSPRPSNGAEERVAGAEDVNSMSAEELRQLSTGVLKAYLWRYGLDSSGIVEKEELVHVILAARASRAEAAPSWKEATPQRQTSQTQRPPQPQPQPQPAAQPPPQHRPPCEAPGPAPKASEPQPQPGPRDSYGASQEVPPPRASAPKYAVPKEIEGNWYRMNGTGMVITGDTITWQDGSEAKMHSNGGSKFNIVLEGKAYHAQLVADQIRWSDGDVWTRTPPKKDKGPQRPKVPEGPRSGAKPQQPKPEPQPPKGPMTRTKALLRLELSGDPTEEEIRKAYKKAALRWHPDRRQNHDCAELAKERFQEVRAAFDMLMAAPRR